MTEIIVTTKEELEGIIKSSIAEIFKGDKREDSKSPHILLSLDEAANFLRLSKQTIYGFTSKRTIPFIKKGKKIYFKQTDLDKWVEAGRKKSRSEYEEEFKNK
jgi:excisionase family DNA binding protein